MRRLLGPEDDGAPGGSPVAVLSYEYWQTTLGGDPAVLNQMLIVNGQSLTIVGVAPAGFQSTTLGLRPQVFVPLTMQEVMQPTRKIMENRRAYWLYLFARRKPGTSIEQARAAINVTYHSIITTVDAPLQQGMSEKTLTAFRAKAMIVKPGARGQNSVSKMTRGPLTMLLAVTVFVLLIACANVANLLLARGASRG